jgi:quinol monooxygenase YgiN
MKYVLIIHEVQDYEIWKKIFDAAATMRQEAGELSYQVLRDAHHRNKIVHFSQWASLVDARAFFESLALEEIRRQAGVESPEFLYLDQLEAGVLDSTED